MLGAFAITTCAPIFLARRQGGDFFPKKRFVTRLRISCDKGWSMSYFRRTGHATAAGDAIAFAVARADATKRRSTSKPIAGLSLAIPVPSILDRAAHGAMTPGPRPERLAAPQPLAGASRRCVLACGAEHL